MGHGRALADAVAEALAGAQTPVGGPVVCAYEEVPVELEPLACMGIAGQHEKC